MWRRLFGSQGRLLSQAGKEVMIKTVGQAIPSYCMSVFLLPVSLCEELQRMMNSFWWGSTPGSKRRIHWAAWELLCQRKDEGGMGFRHLQSFNLAMVGKQVWNLVANPDALASRIIKAKYFPHGDFLSAQLGNNPSLVWRSIWSAMPILAEGCRWRIGNGNSINVWTDAWLVNDNAFRPVTSMLEGTEGWTVHDLWVEGTTEWNMELLNMVFEQVDVEAILGMPCGNKEVEDRIIWHYDKKGCYTVKSGYQLIVDKITRLSGDGGRLKWTELWTVQVPPKVKMFMWRACKNYLPTREILYLKGLQVENTCVLCGEVGEHRMHVFVDCQFATQCWQCVQMTLSDIHEEDFGSWVASMFENLSDEMRKQFCMVIWAIWNHRNQRLWNHVKSSAQHCTVSAMDFLKSYNAAQGRLARCGDGNVLREVAQWRKPPEGTLKMNIDAAVDRGSKTIGLGLVIRDCMGMFVRCKTKVVPGLFSASVAEALCLKEALSWLKEQNLSNVFIESDAKVVVEAFHSANLDLSEFGCILDTCRSISSLCHEVKIGFVRRQANGAAHALAKVARFYASPYYWQEVPNSLRTILLNDVLNS